MPAAQGPPYQPPRKQPAYAQPDIDALVAYVASLGTGPAIPDVDIADADVAARRRAVPGQLRVVPPVGRRRRRAVATASRRPHLKEATADAGGGGDAHRAGRDAGVRRADDHATTQANQIAAYVEYLHDPDDRGGAALGGNGPVPEGFVALRRRAGRARRHQRDGSWGSAVASAPEHARRPRGQPADRRKAERLPAATFAVAIVAALALAVVYWRGGQPQAEGILLAVVLGGIGAGMALWAQRFMPHGPFEEERGPDRVERGGRGGVRRGPRAAAAAASPGAGFLATLAAGALGALGAGRAVPDPLARPAPGQGPEGDAVRDWRRSGSSTSRASRCGPTSWPSTASSPCYPEGYVGAADAPTLLIHLRPGPEHPEAGPGDVGGRRPRRLLEAVHAHGLPGRAVPGPVAASCSAPATSRRSTCPTTATRSSARPPARCRSCRSPSTPTATSWPPATSATPSGPGFWDAER